MPGQVAQILEALRRSLWFVPALSLALAIALAAAGLWASTLTPSGTEPGAPALLFGGGPDEARAMLQTIAGSVITVAGVTFSITVVALQLASSQYSPRVLRNFLRDRGNQVALGIFIGTFAYALLILQTIRDEAGDQAAFVPSVAMTVALGLALLSVGTIVYFIHHISTQIQISSIVEDIADETVRLIRGSCPERDADEAANAPAEAHADGREDDEDDWDLVARARRSGFVQYVAVEALIDVATDAEAVLRVDSPPGAWVDEGGPIVSVRGGPVRDPDALHPHVRIGSERTLQQDASFGVRQLADIAVKALSPGINDPTTATYCVERLATVLIEAGSRADPPAQRHGPDGRAAVVMPVPGFSELVSLAYDQIRHYGGDDAYVMTAVAEALVRTARRTPSDRHAALREQADALVGATDRMKPRTRANELPALLAPLTR